MYLIIHSTDKRVSSFCRVFYVRAVYPNGSHRTFQRIYRYSQPLSSFEFQIQSDDSLPNKVKAAILQELRSS